MNFINIEGLDGSGKSTQIKHLIQYLEKQNIPCKYIHFPRTDSPIYGELIAKFLRGELGDIQSVNPYLVALIYAGDRNDAKQMLYEWINQQYLVIVDRYVYSNIAFQSAKLETSEEIRELSRWIKHLEFEYNGIPRPDQSFFLDVPLEFTKSKLSSRREGSDRQYLKGKQDIHEKSIRFQQQVRKMYLLEAEREEQFHRIDCHSSSGDMLPPEEIMQKMLAYMTR